jgi:hypothetical protein
MSICDELLWCRKQFLDHKTNYQLLKKGLSPHSQSKGHGRERGEEQQFTA